MTRIDVAPDRGSPGSLLLRIVRGDLLGKLPRTVAEKAFRIYRERKVAHVRWTGDDVEGRLELPDVRVRIAGTRSRRGTELYLHRVRSARHAVSPRSGDAHAVDRRPSDHGSSGPRLCVAIPLTPPLRGAVRHLRREDRPEPPHGTRSPLGHRTPALAPANRNRHRRPPRDEVQIRITLPSDSHRTVAFKASLLPSALPLLRSMPRVELEGELAELELSEVRLHPVLAAAWTDQGILLEPSYRVGTRSVLSASELQGRIFGRWAKVGRHLCLVLDPATPLVPFHRKGRQVLQGQDALRFLSLDHPQLQPHSWYLPQGALATFPPAHHPETRKPQGAPRQAGHLRRDARLRGRRPAGRVVVDPLPDGRGIRPHEGNDPARADPRRLRTSGPATADSGPRQGSPR
jgi:hypothetical protein